MGIVINNGGVLAVFRDTEAVLRIMLNGEKIWPLVEDVLSCFAQGYWIDDYPWTDDTPWKD